MTLNNLNLLIGLAIGFALGIWLRTTPPPERESELHVMRGSLRRAG